MIFERTLLSRKKPHKLAWSCALVTFSTVTFRIDFLPIWFQMTGTWLCFLYTIVQTVSNFWKKEENELLVLRAVQDFIAIFPSFTGVFLENTIKTRQHFSPFRLFFGHFRRTCFYNGSHSDEICQFLLILKYFINKDSTSVVFNKKTIDGAETVLHLLATIENNLVSASC